MLLLSPLQPNTGRFLDRRERCRRSPGNLAADCVAQYAQTQEVAVDHEGKARMRTIGSQNLSVAQNGLDRYAQKVVCNSLFGPMPSGSFLESLELHLLVTELDHVIRRGITDVKLSVHSSADPLKRRPPQAPER